MPLHCTLAAAWLSLAIAAWPQLASGEPQPPRIVIEQLRTAWEAYRVATPAFACQLVYTSSTGKFLAKECYAVSSQNGVLINVRADGDKFSANAWVLNESYLACLQSKQFTDRMAIADAGKVSWGLTELHYLGAEANHSAIESARLLLDGPIAMSAGKVDNLERYFSDDTLKLLAGVDDAGRIFVACESAGTISDAKPDKTSNARFTFGPAPYHLIHSSTSLSEESSSVTKYQYETLAGLPFLSSVNLAYHPVEATSGGSSGMDIFFEDVSKDPIDPRLFRLPHFGLPEPGELPHSTNRRILLILVASGIVLLFVGLRLRRISEPSPRQ